MVRFASEVVGTSGDVPKLLTPPVCVLTFHVAKSAAFEETTIRLAQAAAIQCLEQLELKI